MSIVKTRILGGTLYTDFETKTVTFEPDAAEIATMKNDKRSGGSSKTSGPLPGSRATRK